MEVGGSSDDSSGNKRKLGAATTGATGATSATTGPIANGNSSQHTSDQGTSQGSNSLANPDSTTSTASSKAQSSETPPKARFKIGTREGSAQEESGSKQNSPRLTDSQLAGVNGWTTPLNNEEAEMARGKHLSRSISVSSRSQNQFLTTLLSFQVPWCRFGTQTS